MMIDLFLKIMLKSSPLNKCRYIYKDKYIFPKYKQVEIIKFVAERNFIWRALGIKN